MADGIRRCEGYSVSMCSEHMYRWPDADVAVFYGLSGQLPRVLRDYRAAGRCVVTIDLGYWGRKTPANWSGYHKVVVNGRHPTEYFRRHRHSADRFAGFGQALKPWHAGEYVVVAGMSAKAASVNGLGPEEWERRVIAELKAITGMPIVYRPKPSWTGAAPIEGTRFSPATESLDDLLRNCHALVAHHSNAAVDAIVRGVQVHAVEGVATTISMPDLRAIEVCHFPEGREQWLADLAWTQFSLEEMRSGFVWRHLLSEGLVP